MKDDKAPPESAEWASIKQRWGESTDGTPPWHCSKVKPRGVVLWPLALSVITGCKWRNEITGCFIAPSLP